MCRRNLYFSSVFGLSLLAAHSIAQLDRPNPADVIPSTGARPELLTVLDMRNDSDQARRLLAKSAQGLMNAENRTDKIYIVLSDRDNQWLQGLVKQQFVLSSAKMHDLEKLLRRYPSRDAILCDDTTLDVAASVAACEKLLLVTDPRLVSKHHLNVKQDLRGKWASADQARSWLIEKYGKKFNRRIVGLTPDAPSTVEMLDYQMANHMLTIGAVNDSAEAVLTTKLDKNIPCLTVSGAPDRRTMDRLSGAAKFVIPVDGISNLSVWTTFRPFEKGVDESNSGATAQPRAMYKNPHGLPLGNWVGPDSRPQKLRMPWLRELTPPIFEMWARQRNGGLQLDANTYTLGLVSGDQYGSAFGQDCERIWA